MAAEPLTPDEIETTRKIAEGMAGGVSWTHERMLRVLATVDDLRRQLDAAQPVIDAAVAFSEAWAAGVVNTDAERRTLVLAVARLWNADHPTAAPCSTCSDRGWVWDAQGGHMQEGDGQPVPCPDCGSPAPASDTPSPRTQAVIDAAQAIADELRQWTGDAIVPDRLLDRLNAAVHELRREPWGYPAPASDTTCPTCGHPDAAEGCHFPRCSDTPDGNRRAEQ